jgi:arabinogalactan endo-1,4-beta-galactosidase
MYTAIKLGEKVAKGALLGVFYGESQWLAVMGSNGGTWPHHCTLGQYAYSSRCTAP